MLETPARRWERGMERAVASEDLKGFERLPTEKRVVLLPNYPPMFPVHGLPAPEKYMIWKAPFWTVCQSLTLTTLRFTLSIFWRHLFVY